jgi:pyruvate,water dikinase
MIPVPLAEATDERLFGGKAVQLGRALRAHLPVPDGFGCSWPLIERAATDGAGFNEIERAFGALASTVAVRSSAIGEDSGAASFAGQHLTVLNVGTASALERAIRAVHSSATSEAALAYRARLGIDTAPRMAIVVQRLIDPICAGVLFTRDPLDGADVSVIEASWGLGEAVVQGLVTPDRFRLGADGGLLESVAGTKDVMLKAGLNGEVEEVPVDAERVTAPCLDMRQLGRLFELGRACGLVFGGPQDVEWAIADERLFLLQSRPITTLPALATV